MVSAAGAAPETVGVDTWNGFHAHQIFDDHITDPQAAADAARYDVVWGSNEPAAWLAGNPNLITSWYMAFDGDGTLAHDLNWWKAFHPGWILYKCDKRTPAYPSGVKNIPLDISNPAVVKWQMQTYATIVEAGGYQAFAFDLVGLGNANGGCGVWINGVWHPRFTGQLTDDAWSQAVLGWFRYAYTYLHSLPRPLLVGINNVPANRPVGDPEQQQLLTYMDFLNDEAAFTSYGSQYVSQARVVQIVDWMKYTQGLQKVYNVDDKWNTTSLTQQQLYWALSTYLLGKYHHSSVFIDHMPGYGYEYYYPEYAAAVGHPCGDMYADTTHSGVYYRKYSGAFVVVNATGRQSYTVTLPKIAYTTIDGSPVRSPLTIGPDWGQVLMTTQGCL